ncbi:hypothetical protein MNV49_000435 [Pseudohyphozyma bogoriensis]|nr:hypothetical protein MNV49_000435 [Pseudohyphozyma bogoriensis]
MSYSDEGEGDDITLNSDDDRPSLDGRSRASSSDAEPAQPRTARERKREALFPPISNVCQALGGFEEFRTEDGGIEQAYSLGDSVIGCLKDLKRFWRMDEKDDDRTVSRIFYEVGVLKNDLIPILLSTLNTSKKGDRIALACVELMGAMTWPINVMDELLDAKAQDELVASMDYYTLITAQLSYKAAILQSGALRAMFQLMSPSLGKNRRERTPKDEAIITLVLNVFRNLAFLKDRITTSNSADAIQLSQLQSDYIVQLESEHIFDLLVAIAGNAENSEFAPWNMLALDIFHLILRGVKPAELMVPAAEVDETRLKDLLELEGSLKKASARATTSRHSRFGTTVALKSGGKNYIIHKQSSLAKGAEKTMDDIKKSKAKKVRQDDDLQPPSHLRPEAIKVLHDVAVEFIDSAFNPFFASILKDIRMERLKVKESDTVRFMFLARFFLEFFLLLQADEKKKGISPLSEKGHDFDLIAEMTEPSSIAFVTARIKNSLEEKPVPWMEVHAALDCFIQMLLVIDALSVSGVEENIEVAEILQNKLYYEADTLDMVVAVISKYTNQSLKYLDSVINLAYVLLRMLEKYSKSKAYMYVKKKAKARRKKKATRPEDEEGDGIGYGEDEEEEADRGALSYKEHAFKFSEFELRFCDEPVLQTFMIYLEGYKTFTDPEQLKRIVSLLHRQAIKAKSEGVFFKPTVLELFRRISEDDTFSSSRDPNLSDLKKLIEYVLKKFFKAVKENPLLLVEIFYPKTRSQLGKMRIGVTDPYGSSDDEGPSTMNAKMIADIEVTPGFSLTQQIGIVMAALVDAEQAQLIDLILAQLGLASTARNEIVLTTDGDSAALDDEDDQSDEALRRKASRLQGPSKDAIALFTPHAVQFSEESERKAAWSNAQFKLLMRLLEWESSEVPESQELVWTIPATILPSKLDGDIRIINNFLLDPVDPNGKTAADLLRKKRKAPVRRRKPRIDDEEGEDGETPAKKRQAKKKKEAENFKSAQFIDDSDDEDNEERDRLFFAAEQALRDKLDAGAIKPTATTGSKKKTAAVLKREAKAAEKAARAAAKASKKAAKNPKKKTKFNTELVSDLDDSGSDKEEDELDSDAATPEPVARSDRGSSTELRTSTTASSGGERKRAFSVTSASSGDGVAKGGADVSDAESDVVGVSQAKKRRVVVVDSDDE